MKYKTILHLPYQEASFETLDEAKAFIKQIDKEYVLVNDDLYSRNGYRCRYLWGGYFEGAEAFIIEEK